MHFAYCKAPPHRSIVLGRDNVYISFFPLVSHALQHRAPHKEFCNPQTFPFLPPVSIKPEIYIQIFFFIVLGRKPRSRSCSVTAVAPWTFTHYRCNLLTIRLNRMSISLARQQQLRFFSSSPPPSLRLQCPRPCLRQSFFVLLFTGLQRGYFSLHRFTPRQNLISSASVEFTSPILIEGEIAQPLLSEVVIWIMTNLLPT